MTWLALVLAATPVAADHVEAGPIVAIPHVAVRISDREPIGAAISLPWALKLVSVERKSFAPNWMLIEPGVVIGRETAFRGRLGFRWTWAVTSWLEAGVGFGIAGEFFTKTIRVAPSPEVSVRLGKGPAGFGALFARIEPQLDGSAVGYVGIGYAFW